MESIPSILNAVASLLISSLFLGAVFSGGNPTYWKMKPADGTHVYESVFASLSTVFFVIGLDTLISQFLG